jgi:hypothetical protein
MDCGALFHDVTQAAGVYATLKDETKHGSVISLCEGDCSAKGIVVMALECILGKECKQVSDGLTALASNPPHWRDVVINDDAVKWLKGISRLFPKLVKKSESGTTISSTSSAATVPTRNTGKFTGLTLDDVIPAAYRVVVGAAHKAAVQRGVEPSAYGSVFASIFWTKNKHYLAAYGAVVGGELPQQMSMPEKMLAMVEKAIVYVDRIDVAAQNRVDFKSTEQTDGEHLHAAALNAFSEFVKDEDVLVPDDQVEKLFNKVFRTGNDKSE